MVYISFQTVEILDTILDDDQTGIFEARATASSCCDEDEDELECDLKDEFLKAFRHFDDDLKDDILARCAG